MSDTPRTNRALELLALGHRTALVDETKKLERELADAKNWREVAEGMTKWKDELLAQRDQWRDSAISLAQRLSIATQRAEDAAELERLLKRQQEELK